MNWWKKFFGSQSAVKDSVTAQTKQQPALAVSPTPPPQEIVGNTTSSTKADTTPAVTLGELAATGQWGKLREIVGDVPRFAPTLGDLNASRRIDINGHDRSVVLAMLALTTGQPHFGNDVQMAKEALSNLTNVGGVGSLKAGDVLMIVSLTVCFFDDLRKAGEQRTDHDLADMGAMINKLLAPFSSTSLEELCRSHGVRLPQPQEPAVEQESKDAKRRSELGNLVRACSIQQAMQALGSVMMKSRTCSDISHIDATISLAAEHKTGALTVLDYALTSIPNMSVNMRRGIADITAQIRATGRAQVKATASLAALSVVLPAVATNRQLSEAAGSLVDALFFSLPASVR